jgi:hypothetical protein
MGEKGKFQPINPLKLFYWPLLMDPAACTLRGTFEKSSDHECTAEATSLRRRIAHARIFARADLLFFFGLFMEQCQTSGLCISGSLGLFPAEQDG